MSGQLQPLAALALCKETLVMMRLGWLGHRIGLDVVEKKNLCSCCEFKPDDLVVMFTELTHLEIM